MIRASIDRSRGSFWLVSTRTRLTCLIPGKHEGRRCPRAATAYVLPYKIITGSCAFGAAGIEIVIRLRTVVCGYIDGYSTRWTYDFYASCNVQLGGKFGHRDIMLRCVTFVLRRQRILSQDEVTNPMFLQNERPILTSTYVSFAGTPVSCTRAKRLSHAMSIWR